MSIFSGTKSCVFSGVKAQLFYNGKPVANAKVIRQWEWHKENSDETITDENGYFMLPEVYESSASRLFPSEFVVGQQLSVSVNDEEIIFWSNSKRDPDVNAEFGGAAFTVKCELTEEERLVEDYGSLMVTKCHLEK
ncbi:hypothetical protein P886_1002 [Alteromonadaceae bacterium 2753L.S.0a.02]|nr:hypothetical protein P886_1002 [Alteromonadaceae bacterium 2753L.S.0a.02]